MHFDILLQQVLNGLVLGSVYALVALGYTMVYGILQLINFAHGDVLMIGAMVGVTVVGLLAGSGLPGPVILLIALAAAIPACVVLSWRLNALPTGHCAMRARRRAYNAFQADQIIGGLQ
jgi:branched-chain amino acid transport system permease protein